jgi:acetyltransferase-like isoleucine patch superfamily enzyme
MFVEAYRNNNPDEFLLVENSNKFLLAPFAEVLLSEIAGFFTVGHYSTINRSSVGKYGGLGVSSYIADTIIGNYCSIGSRVSIGGYEHPTNWFSTGSWQWGQGLQRWDLQKSSIEELKRNERPENSKVIINDDCWVGNNVVVLSGVEIGKGCVIGAGSIVTKSLPPYSICVGNPAKVINFRFDDLVVQKLSKLDWCQFSPDELKDINFQNIEVALSQVLELVNRKFNE